MALFFLLVLLAVLVFESRVVGLVLMGIGFFVIFIIGIAKTRGAILLVIPVVGLIWVGYQSVYLWYSPSLWPVATTIAVIAAVIGVIVFLCWLYGKKPALAITIATVLVVAAALWFGIYLNVEEMTRMRGAR